MNTSPNVTTTMRKLDRLPLSNKPTFLITEKLQDQIEYLHKQLGAIEWSGELITSETNTIQHLNDWTIRGEDIFLADVGSPGYTSYEVDKGAFKASDIIELYEAFPGLMEGTHKLQHIHTH